MAKLMKLRRDDVCVDCQEPIGAKTSAYWFADEKVVRCTSCFIAASHDQHDFVEARAGAATSHRGLLERYGPGPNADSGRGNAAVGVLG